jgi:hypothetical protein
MTTLHRPVCIVLTMLLAPIALLGTPPPVSAASTCPGIDAVAIPGTTQTDPHADPNTPVGILGSILEPLKRHSHRTLSTYYTPYPATIFGGDSGGYQASKPAGIDSASAHLKAVAHRCPNTLFLLTGYSQGADAAGDLAAAIGHNKGAVPASRVLGVGLLADPSQSPIDQPTIGLKQPGMGFAGIRTGGFGALGDRNAVLSVCAPLDYYCNLPQNDLVMRFIGHLGAHLDLADATDSARKLATMFMAGLIAPATAAIKQILQLVDDPQLIPNLARRGIAFADALAQQLFWLAGPQVAATASTLINAAHDVIALIRARAWTSLPALIASIATTAHTTGAALSQLQTKSTDVDVSGFGAVGTQLASATPHLGDLVAAVLTAINVATGGIGTHATGLFGPTFAQFSADTVATALTHFAEFIKGDFHGSYDTTALDPSGHTGTQLVQRYFINRINQLA